jgi:competence protein ComEA
VNLEKIRKWVNDNHRRVILAGVGVLMIGAGVFWWKSGTIVEDSDVKILSSEIGSQEIVVDIAGAVARPGVYRLKTDTRIEDAINSAGGLTGEEDQVWVEKNLNRSAKINDGQKIYIPRKSQISNPNNQTNSNIQIQNTKININSAGVGELDKLPGIGEVTAGKIISGRPYTQTEELLTRKIVSQKVWEQIKDTVSTW